MTSAWRVLCIEERYEYVLISTNLLRNVSPRTLCSCEYDFDSQLYRHGMQTCKLSALLRKIKCEPHSPYSIVCGRRLTRMLLSTNIRKPDVGSSKRVRMHVPPLSMD